MVNPWMLKLSRLEKVQHAGSISKVIEDFDHINEVALFGPWISFQICKNIPVAAVAIRLEPSKPCFLAFVYMISYLLSKHSKRFICEDFHKWWMSNSAILWLSSIVKAWFQFQLFELHLFFSYPIHEYNFFQSGIQVVTVILFWKCDKASYMNQNPL